MNSQTIVNNALDKRITRLEELTAKMFELSEQIIEEAEALEARVGEVETKLAAINDSMVGAGNALKVRTYVPE